MKRKDMLRKLQFPLILVLGSLPVCPVLYVYLKPELEGLGWIFPGACLLLSMAGMLIPGKKRFVYGGACCVLFLALGVLALSRRFSLFVLTAPVLCCVLLLWCLTMAGWSWEEELSPVCFWLGAACHVVGQFFVTARVIHHQPGARRMEGVLLAAFFLFVLLSMLSMNRDSMAASTVRRRRAAASMRWKNTILTVALFVLALLIFLIPAAVRAVEQVCLWLLRAVGWLLNALVSVIPLGGSGTPQDGGGFADLPVENVPPPLLLQILEWVLLVLVGAAVVAAAAAGVWLLGRKLVKLVRLLWNGVSRYAANVGEDYEDVVTDTREEGKREGALRRYLSRRRDRVDERALDPAQRIRYRYGRLRERHPEWTAAATARETLPQPAADLYERVRYGEYSASGEEAEQFVSGTRRV